jgi:hypothetical protein
MRPFGNGMRKLGQEIRKARADRRRALDRNAEEVHHLRNATAAWLGDQAQAVRASLERATDRRRATERSREAESHEAKDALVHYVGNLKASVEAIRREHRTDFREGARQFREMIRRGSSVPGLADDQEMSREPKSPGVGRRKGGPR